MATKCEKCGEKNKLKLYTGIMEGHSVWETKSDSHKIYEPVILNVFYSDDDECDLEVCVECGWIQGWNSKMLKKYLKKEIENKKESSDSSGSDS